MTDHRYKLKYDLPNIDFKQESPIWTKVIPENYFENGYILAEIDLPLLQGCQFAIIGGYKENFERSITTNPQSNERGFGGGNLIVDP